VRDAVVLTGDVRAHRAADLELDHDDPTGPSAGYGGRSTSPDHFEHRYHMREGDFPGR
jgi:hypothetical protein